MVQETVRNEVRDAYIFTGAQVTPRPIFTIAHGDRSMNLLLHHRITNEIHEYIFYNRFLSLRGYNFFAVSSTGKVKCNDYVQANNNK